MDILLLKSGTVATIEEMLVHIIVKYFHLQKHAVYIIQKRCTFQQFTWYLKGKNCYGNTETNKKELQMDESQYYMQDKKSNLFQIELALNYSKHFNEAFLNCFVLYDRQEK